MILKIPIRIERLEADGFHLFIKGVINGQDVNLLLDTGASKTVFDLKRISKIVKKRKKSFDSFENLSTGLGTSKMKSHYTIIKEFIIGELMFNDYKAILLDMSHVNESYQMLGFNGIDGVLGSDLLMEYKAVIDYKNLILKLVI